MADQDIARAAAARAWAAIKAGEKDKAARLVEEAEAAGASAAEICLLRAHAAEACGAFRDALQLAFQGLAVLAEVPVERDSVAAAPVAGNVADGADAGSNGCLDDLAAVSHSLERLAARVGERSTGFAWEAVFASKGAANAASARYSMLIGQANAQPIAKDAKVRLTKHFALCTVTCDYSLHDREGKGASLLGRLKGRLGRKGARSGDNARRAHDGSSFISADGPAYELTGPFREDEWGACSV